MILLDGHARMDTAEELYGVDPAPLRQGLSLRGFTIAERSRSNYPYTSESLTSLLEQAHLAEIPRMAGLLAGTESQPVGAVVERVLNDSKTIRFLRARGYEIEAIAPGFEQVNLREAESVHRHRGDE